MAMDFLKIGMHMADIMATRLKEKPYERITKMIYKFPKGMKCSNSKFNDTSSDSLNLTPIFDGVTDKYKGVPYLTNYLCFQLIVEGSVEKIKGKCDDRSKDNALMTMKMKTKEKE